MIRATRSTQRYIGLVAVLIGITADRVIAQSGDDRLPTGSITDAAKAAAAKKFLGCGYKLEQPFASGDSCAAPIFDLSTPGSYDLKDVPGFQEQVYSGSSLTSYMNSFSAKGDATFPAYGALVTLKADISTKLTKKNKHTFVTVMDSFVYFRGTLTGAKVIPSVQNDIDGKTGLSYPALFQKYGTHYTRSLRFGASMAMTAVVDKSLESNEIDAGLVARVEMQKVTKRKGGKGDAKEPKIGGGGEVRNKYNSLVQEVNATRTIQVIGGDPRFGRTLVTPGGDVGKAYADWSASIPANLNIAAMSLTDDLAPLWDLTADPKRKSEMQAAARDYYKQYAVVEGYEIVHHNSPFYLETNNGKVVGSPSKNTLWASTNRYYYPGLSTSVSDAEPFQFGKKAADRTDDVLKTGKVMVIQTTNGNSTPSGYSGYDRLVVFKSGVGFWNYDDSSCEWTLERVGKQDKGHTIFFGDKVRFKNGFYTNKPYLQADNSAGYLWSKASADDDTIFIIRPIK